MNQVVIDALRILENRRRIPCVIGQADPDNLGEYVLTGSSALRVPVTFQDGTVHEAINTKVTARPGLTVLVDRDVRTGELYIVGTDPERQIQLLGSGAPNYEVPPHTHQVGFGNEDPVEPRRFLPGLMHAYSGLTVQVESFRYLTLAGAPARCAATLVDLTSARPSTSGYHAWVKVYWNPSTSAFGTVTGTEYSLTVPLTEVELDAVSIPADCYEIGALQMWQGQSAIEEEKYFSDPRIFLQRRLDALRVDLQARVATTLTLSSGAVTLTRGNHVIAAESGTTDDLVTLNGLVAGQFYLLRADAGDTITVMSGADNIWLSSGASIVLSGDKTLLLWSPDGSTAVDMTNQAVVYKDDNIGALTLQTGGTLPGIVEWLDNTGTATGIYTRGFAIGEEGSAIRELQHDYREGSDIVFHVHWAGNDAPSGTDYVKWQIKYFVSRTGETTPASTTITVETAYDTQYEHVRSDFPAVTGTNFKIGDQVNFSIKRIAASGDAYAGEALIETIGFHYQADSLGSRSISAK